MPSQNSASGAADLRQEILVGLERAREDRQPARDRLPSSLPLGQPVFSPVPTHLKRLRCATAAVRTKGVFLVTTSDTQLAVDDDEQLVLRWERPWLRQLGQQPEAPDGIEGVSDQMRDWLIARLAHHATETATMPANVKVSVTVAFGEGEWTPAPVPEGGMPVGSWPSAWMGVDEMEISLRWERPWLRQLGQQPPPFGADGVEGVRATMRDWVISRLIRRFEHTAGAMPDIATVTMRVELDPPEWTSENVSPMPLGTVGN